MYPPDLPTIRNNAHPASSPSNELDDTANILLARTPPQPDFPRVRGYEILSLIGSGGMGVVYKARHSDLRRTVALKMLHETAMADAEARERFQAEAEAVARVQHPNIIQVFEIGTVQPSVGERLARPFLSLEFMDGGCLTRFTETPQAPIFAARLIEKLARAAHAAHLLGVVHRDLKPANVLFSKDGEPKIADFGVAKLSGNRDRLLTQAGMTVGTPEYMAPEQAAGEDASPAADIYSLGAILYQLLTAHLPFHGSNPVDTMYLVRNEEPVSPRRFQPSLPRDLETICLKCLAKKPGRRYATAEALANDLARWAEGRTIQARPVGRFERSLMWVKRNPVVASLSVAIVLVSSMGLTVIVWKWRDSEHLARTATLEADRAKAEKAFARWEQYRADILAVSAAVQLENANSARRLLDAAPAEYHRNWEWRYFRNQLDISSETFATEDKLYVVNTPPGAEHVITLADGNRACLWQVAGGKLLASFTAAAHIGRSTPHPEGDSIAYIVGDPEANRVVIRDLKSNKPDLTLGRSEKRIMTVRYSPDGAFLATGSVDGFIRIYEIATGREAIAFQATATPVSLMDFSRDGTQIAACGSGDKAAAIWDVKTSKRLHHFADHPHQINGVALNAAGDRLLAAAWSPSSTFWLWDVTNGKRLVELAGHNNQVRWYGFSGDGSVIATCCLDQKARLWDGRTGQLRFELRGHTGWVEHAAFSPNSKRLATASQDCTVRLWDTATGHCVAVMRGHTGPVLNVGFSRDGSTIVSTSKDGAVKSWNVAEMERGNAIRGHERYVYGVACHPDNERIASASWDGTVRIWNSSTREELKKLVIGNTIVPSVSFHPGGKLLASVSRDDTVRLWDVDTGREVHRWNAPIGHWMDTRITFSPDGKLLATGDNRNRVRIWNVDDRTEYATLEGHKFVIRDLAFSPDGRFLATAGSEGDLAIRIWDVEKRELVKFLPKDERGESSHSDSVYSLAYHPSGEWLASGSMDGTARLWNTKTWGSFELKHASNVYGLAFTPDGNRLATACSDRSIRIWDVATRQELAELRGHDDYVHSVAFTPDGERLVSGSGDSTIRIWDSRPRPGVKPNRP